VAGVCEVLCASSVAMCGVGRVWFLPFVRRADASVKQVSLITRCFLAFHRNSFQGLQLL
jgi:hypothetical protein